MPEPRTLAEAHGTHAAASRVRSLLAADADSFAGFAPHALEWTFGFEDDPPHDMGGFSLKGRIDRIDRGDAGLVVMDYKWGSVPSHTHFDRRGVVQLPLYARIARERMGVDVVAGLYRGLGSEEDRGFARRGAVMSARLKPRGADWVDEDGIDEVLDDALDRARAAVSGIREGWIAPEPRTPDSCRYCAATAICGRGR
jgi:hypothetical protein